MAAEANSRISPAKLALAVRRLRAEKENLDLVASDPIAIIGMACRFPGGADSPEAFWTALAEGRDCVGEIPAGRWKDAAALPLQLRQGGYLRQIDGFDAAYFGISPREAQHMDPQQRLLLEVAWEALWDAGLEPGALDGSDAGVFAAIYNNDYARLDLRDPATLTAHAGVGSAHSVAAGRLSFLLNIKGPSLALDSACSSSLVAVHLACQSLRSQECGLAIAAASSLKLLSDEVQVFSKWGMLASDGRCKTFDAAADGFGPGEGSGVLILKRLSDALQDGDRVRAVIRGTAVNHDGKTTVLTAPNGLAQQAVLRAALKNARLDPQEVSYIEAHGTGTSLGDPIEMEAVSAVYGQPAPDGRPCMLGAVKSNLGHLEAAAGIAGMIKTVLCLEHGEIPRNLHFHRLNPEISLVGTRLKIATENLLWKRGGQPRVAGISSFGLGGTNGHVLLEEAPLLPVRDATAGGRQIPLPAYKWQRQRFWLAEPATPQAKLPAVAAATGYVHPLLGRQIDSPFVKGNLFASDLNPSITPWLAEHRLGVRAIVPFAAFLEIAAAAMWKATPLKGNGAIGNFLLREPLFVPSGGCRLQVLAGDGAVEIASENPSGWTTHAKGSFEPATAEAESVNLDRSRARINQRISPEEIYTRLEQTGLHYGSAFRVIQSAWSAPEEALAHLRLPDDLARQAEQYGIHPTLLDGCLQTVMAARRADAGELFLPISVDRFELQQTGQTELWVQTKITAASAEALSADISIMDRFGRMVACLRGFTARRTRTDLLRPPGEDSTALMYELAWHPCPLTPGASAIRAGERWLLVEHVEGNATDLAHALTQQGAICTMVREADFYDYAVRDAAWAGIVYDARDAETPRSGSEWARPEKSAIDFLFQFVRSLAVMKNQLPRFRVIVSSAVAVLPNEDVSVAQAPLWGMMRTLALEYPDISPTLLDAGPRHSGPGSERERNATLAEEIVAPSPEAMVAWRHGTRYVARLVHPAPRENHPQKLQFSASGRLEDLQFVPAARTEPEPHQVEIAVRAAGLNFRDVLTALGMLPARMATPGAECTGIIVRVGSEVKAWKAGDQVLAFAPAALQSFVHVPAEFVVRKPAAMTFTDAAGIPVAFLTALHGLNRLAGLSVGQSILIHAAAGGLGMAAVQLAIRAGAVVFATAGSPEKREFLRRLGVKHIFDSRSLAFREQVLEATGGRGVDVVLNSLAGDFIAASFDVVAHGGCFLEVGKRGLWSPEEVAALGKNIRYFPFDLGDVAFADPGRIAEMLGELMPSFSTGELRPLPTELYSFDDPAPAFRTMAQARHIGKIVLGMDAEESSTTIDDVVADGTVLVTGGLGALGIETARWLVGKGARNLVLAGRNAPQDHPIAAELEAQGATVAIERADVASARELEMLLRKIRASHPPLRAVFHVAGVVQDAVLSKESWNSYRAATAPKIEAAWNLDRLTQDDPLRLMVFFSSAASVVGSPGQGSYAAGNAFLDALAHHRSSRGLRTLSVNWGAWAAVGMAARLSAEQAARWTRQGAKPLQPATALDALENAIASGRSQVSILDMDWERFSAAQPGRGDAALFQELSDSKPQPTSGLEAEAASHLLEAIHSAPAADRRSMVASYVKACARRVMGLDPATPIQDNIPLQDIGLDSLMALEMRNELAPALALTLPAGLLFDYPSVDQLTSHLLGLLAKLEIEEAAAQAPVDSLSEEEAERLLIEELDRGEREKAHA